VNGEIIQMPPTGFKPGRASYRTTKKLMEYEEQTQEGFAIPDNVAFKVNLPNRKSFSPDASFFKGEPSDMKFLEGSPIFAVEVRSENDYGNKAEKAIQQKRYDYFAAGTEIVWDVDLLSDDVIKSYHLDNPNEPKIYKRGEIADAEPALPGWKMPVDELFE
ncbi:MAG: Uma2 family endonuclease, partial [Aridibacter sp.]